MNKPYVYIIQNKDRTHWYVGMRSANECPAIEDTGYWGSSTYLDELIEQTGKENWTKTIIKEFDTWQEAKAHEDELLELMWDWDGRVNKAVNGFVDHNDPEVKAKHLAGCQKNAQNPEWIAKNKAANEAKAQDPEWIANHTAAMQELAQNPVWQVNQKAGSQKRSEDPEWKANQKAAGKKRSEDPVWQANQKVGGQKRSKPFIATCIATGEEFYCESGVCDQAKALKLDQGNIANCLNGKLKQTKGYTFRYV